MTDFDELRAALSGRVITPGEDGYDDARRLWNAAHDRRPAVIAQPRTAEDVQVAVRFGVAQGLELAVRGGSHSLSGASSVDDGLMIDLSLLNTVTVDPETRRARVGGGAKLADLDAATQAHGLAVPAGMISHTGVGGLTLGGGMGWLTRKFGLSIDNLESVRIVTADGSLLRAAEDENPALFWAVRGGGGNFGVVTEFEFRLHEAGPMVQYGLQFWGLEQGADVLRLARELIPALPPEINVVIACLNAPPAPFVPEQHHFEQGHALVVVGLGSPEQHGEVLETIRTALPPLFEFASPMPYVALQQTLDEPNRWGQYCYERGSYLEDLSDGAIDVITDQFPRKSSPLSISLLYRLDHAYSAVPDDATAFSGGRTDRYAIVMVAVCPTPEPYAAERAWVRSFWDALRPHTLGIGSYVNGMTEGEDDRIRAAYGDKYLRLQQLKAKYDPDNAFHRNQNIKPLL
ncbi:FAD-binding oxidoreductase [Kribbella sindirgiensis]|uniref:FAD-binding oxidoreductase n=1 Tax=Kribbella sindirgiensis TaxID=1124744 RepID=A0A4R0ID48_9ACTN|nr:FAD-binding oxidoreductase [Kribbella sindirgiensis]TCC29840.1 FAD-binding oxidoreductase [Kribbella sindirgiensis]